MNLFSSLGPGPGQIHFSKQRIDGVDNERGVRVYVPKRYGSYDAHPLLVLFDGQNVFDDAPSFAGGWHMHEAAERLTRVRKPAPIVVGIDNGGAQRIRELAPSDSRFGATLMPLFLAWIAGPLLTTLRASLRIVAGPGGVIIGGSSMGGLAAYYAHLLKPETFGGALCMSPSFWFAGDSPFELLDRTTKPWTTRVYLDAGTREARGSMAAGAKRMSETLRAKGWTEQEVLLRLDPRGTHNEASWRRRASGALKYCFPKA